MALTLQLYSYFLCTGGAAPQWGGSLHTPVSMSIDGTFFRRDYSVAVETTVKVFDVDQHLANFDFLWMQTDFDVMVEFVTDDDADVGEVVSTMKLRGTDIAGSYGFPLILAYDDSYANYTVNFAAGTLDVIETIRVRNLSTTDAATVHLTAAT